MNYTQTAQEICTKIVDAVSSIDELKRSTLPFALDVYLDGTSYDAIVVMPDIKHYDLGSRPEDYAGDSEVSELVQLEALALPCVSFSIQSGIAIFECMDPLDAVKQKCATLASISDEIQRTGTSNIKKAVVKMHSNSNKIEVAGIQSCEYCDVTEDTLHNGKDAICLSYVELDKVLDLNYLPTIEKIASQQYFDDLDYSSSMKKLGKRFYKDEDIDECDGGGAVAGGGDAGGAAGAAAVGGDAGDTAGEMAGTTTTEVLGTCKPGEGYMGKDNFYIPARAKVPLHHWEAANGGSKRKKKGKYPYEKGMKVVVSMFEDEAALNEAEGYASYEALRGAEWEDVKAAALAKAMNKADKDGVRFDKWAFENSLAGLHDRWEAAQLDPPDTTVHGEINACRIDEDRYQKKDYLKNFFVHGWYDDGTMLEIGPITRGVASAYISLHKLSLNSTAFRQMKDANFSSVKEIGHNDPSDKIPLTIVKFKDGYWLYSPDTRFKAGPFANKQLARMYAMSQRYTMEKKSPSDKAEQVERLEYPTFAFSYTMAGIPCMDIVVAEDIKRAMKLFDFQWRVYDNTRPIKQVFNTVDDLKRDLSLLRIKDIEIEELDGNNIDEYVSLAKETGNPSTIPTLAARCKNPKFRYLLGRDGRTGRSPVVINW